MTTGLAFFDDETRFAALPTCTDVDGAALGESSGPLVGSDVDARFTKVRLLGTGGVGEVHLAHDRVLDRLVALKLMKRVRAGAVPSLLDESRATSRVVHPNVVRVLDAGAHRGEVFIAFEYVEGTNLRQHARGPARVGARAGALRLLKDIAAGLAAAHAVDVLHLDVKPENVLVGIDGRARVLDFGLARVRVGGACVELEGACAGTPAYMAPELWAGEGVCDGTDVWSFAVLACELLTGRRPFEAQGATEIMAAVLGQGVRVPPLDGVQGVTPELASLLAASLVRDRRARPLMRELEAALARSH